MKDETGPTGHLRGRECLSKAWAHACDQAEVGTRA